jgi:hypothetical protein
MADGTQVLVVEVALVLGLVVTGVATIDIFDLVLGWTTRSGRNVHWNILACLLDLGLGVRRTRAKCDEVGEHLYWLRFKAFKKFNPFFKKEGMRKTRVLNPYWLEAWFEKATINQKWISSCKTDLCWTGKGKADNQEQTQKTDLNLISKTKAHEQNELPLPQD